jgi:hypothetical protein
MVGRLYTIEDEIDVLHEDLGRARRALNSMLRAKHDGREADATVLDKEVRRQTQRVRALELELGEALSSQQKTEEP